MISSKVEESRIQAALRGCKERGYEVFEPMKLIKKAISEFGDSIAVCCSFGSCSVSVLHMALQIKPDITVVFNNTGVEYAETYAYRDLLRKEWDLNPPQYVETKPIKPFWQCVKEYGFPLLRGPYPKADKPKCCTYLKEKPFAEIARKLGIKAILTGLRASESRARMFCMMYYGQFYYEKTRMKVWKFHPIAFWDHKQVWEYFQKRAIPINEVYTKLGLERNGCMPCTSFLNWEKQLARINPKMYRYVQKLRGVSLLDDFIALENKMIDKCGFQSRQQVLEEWF